MRVPSDAPTMLEIRRRDRRSGARCGKRPHVEERKAAPPFAAQHCHRARATLHRSSSGSIERNIPPGADRLRRTAAASLVISIRSPYLCFGFSADTESREFDMGCWTAWKKLADRRQWYSAALPDPEPGCYELATGGPRGGNLVIQYIGETGNLRSRLRSYGQTGSHLGVLIDAELRRGSSLFFRVYRRSCKEEAVAMEYRQLRRWLYQWNTRIPA
jgi:hypothetical protein